MRFLLPLWCALAFACAYLAVACGGDDDSVSVETPAQESPGPTASPAPTSEVQISVNLTEYIVAPQPESVAAGPITFVAHNIGSTNHELVAIRTDDAPDALPTKENGSVDGGDEDVSVIGDTDPFPPGEDRNLTLNLEPGSYVLVCDVVQEVEGEEPIVHYQERMRAAFDVTQ